MLIEALVLAAFVAGLAGTWSPCGLSMVETLRPAGSRAAALGSALAFAVGALIGGTVTFGGLALLGTAVGATGAFAAAVAAALLLIAALGDVAGRRIVPQVRRQVPESWRRTLPLSLASALYGVLLGLGFTTFVLSYATWGLAAAALAIGGPATGLAVGLAFGLGRALPIVWLAPQQESGRAATVLAAMGERPDVLRGLRLAAAVGLVAAAAALIASPPTARADDGPAGAATSGSASSSPSGAAASGPSGAVERRPHASSVFQESAADPSASPGGRLAWQAADRSGRLLLPDGQVATLPGTDPAVSDAFVAWRQDAQIVVAESNSLVPLRVVDAPGADAIAVSDGILAWRSPTGPGSRDQLSVLNLADPAAAPAVVRTAVRGGSLGRPSAAGTQVLVDDQQPTISRLLSFDLATGRTTVLRSARHALLLNPAIRGNRLLYVRSDYQYQRLEVGRAAKGDGRADRTLYSTTPTARRDVGHEPGDHDHRAGYGKKGRPRKAPRPPRGLVMSLWTTALAPDAAYVTRVRHVRGGGTVNRIVRVTL